MKKVIIKLILAFNAMLWIILSFINYIGIIKQLDNDIMRIFLWTIFTVIMYGVVIYSLTLGMKRVLVLQLFKDSKYKFISNKNFTKQLLLLSGMILYLYGLCYFSSIFLGLIPMWLFFGSTLTNMGRLYIYDNGRLFMMEDISKEYQVYDFDRTEMKLTFKEIGSTNHKLIEMTYKMDDEETKFLSGIFIGEIEEERDFIPDELMQEFACKEQEI